MPAASASFRHGRSAESGSGKNSMKKGISHATGKREAAVRNRLKVEYELPLGEAYAEKLRGFIAHN
ncbi:MAG: hypothetical protein K2N73_02510 [Lachnospiraceae bacterium]|nr:hypothetical protein [Lachnospiraceae bacterium]